MNPIITSAITQIYVPASSIHIYYDDEVKARQESFRTGCPFFISVIGGVRMYSVRLAITNLK